MGKIILPKILVAQISMNVFYESDEEEIPLNIRIGKKSATRPTFQEYKNKVQTKHSYPK